MQAIGWRTLIIVTVAASLLGEAAEAPGIEFHRDVAAARRTGKPERPVVIFFGAAWCGWCRKMAADTLIDPKVAAIADQFNWVKIDVDKQPELAARYGVEGVPAIVVLDTQGRILGSRGGFIPPDKFVEFLTTSVKNPLPEELLPDLLDRFAKADAAPQRRETARRLVEQLARPDRLGRGEVLDAFKKKGPAAWPVLLEMMADNRLSVRAAAAGALKSGTQADIPFHPFARPEVRQQQLAAWQKWLAAHPAVDSRAK